MKWTSLKVKKPEHWVVVLMSNGIHVESGYVVPGGGVRWSLGTNAEYPVTHWMPVPKPPKAGKRKGKK